MCEILKKFEINSLYICPPYLYNVATFSWEICCLLLCIIRVALFYCQFFLSLWSVIFRDTNANQQPALFRVTKFGGTQHYLQSDVKVLHFTRYCGDIFRYGG